MYEGALLVCGKWRRCYGASCDIFPVQKAFTRRSLWSGSSSFYAPVIVDVPPPRASAAPPEPIPVVHSPAYLYRSGVTELVGC